MAIEGGTPLDRECPKCGGSLRYELHEASDGGHEDMHIFCTGCVYNYWIDGIDS